MLLNPKENDKKYFSHLSFYLALNLLSYHIFHKSLQTNVFYICIMLAPLDGGGGGGGWRLMLKHHQILIFSVLLSPMMHPTSSSRFSFPVLCSHKIIIEKTGEPMSTVKM
jgi:hypothetical protein